MEAGSSSNGGMLSPLHPYIGLASLHMPPPATGCRNHLWAADISWDRSRSRSRSRSRGPGNSSRLTGGLFELGRYQEALQGLDNLEGLHEALLQRRCNVQSQYEEVGRTSTGFREGVNSGWCDGSYSRDTLQCRQPSAGGSVHIARPVHPLLCPRHNASHNALPMQLSGELHRIIGSYSFLEDARP